MRFSLLFISGHVICGHAARSRFQIGFDSILFSVGSLAFALASYARASFLDISSGSFLYVFLPAFMSYFRLYSSLFVNREFYRFVDFSRARCLFIIELHRFRQGATF